MPQPTQENIAPLIADLQSSGRSVRVVFRCPVSGDQVNASHSVTGRPAASSQMMNSAKRSMMYSLQSAVSTAIRDVFGYNMVGRVASDVARSAVRSATQNTSSNSLSASEQRAAALEAFKKVSSRFVWDSNRGHWISAKAAQELLSPFERQLGEHPVSHNYDRTVLARMLVEVARADGRLSNEENTWLTDFIAPDLGSVRDLAARPPLSSWRPRSGIGHSKVLLHSVSQKSMMIQLRNTEYGQHLAARLATSSLPDRNLGSVALSRRSARIAICHAKPGCAESLLPAP